MPSNIGATLLITVISNGVTYYLPVIVASVVHGFYVTSNDGQIHISLIPEDNNIMTLEDNPLGTAYGKSYWILDIYNVTNGEIVYHQIISDFSCDINTLSWKKGLYALHIEIGDTVYNEKILVK